jgi:hypothetical protein
VVSTGTFLSDKIVFSMETRSSLSKAAATLCTHGEFSISGRRYKMKSLKPAKTKTVYPRNPLPCRIEACAFAGAKEIT